MAVSAAKLVSLTDSSEGVDQIKWMDVVNILHTVIFTFKSFRHPAPASFILVLLFSTQGNNVIL